MSLVHQSIKPLSLAQEYKSSNGVVSKTPEEYQGYIAQNWPYPTIPSYTTALEPDALSRRTKNVEMKKKSVRIIKRDRMYKVKCVGLNKLIDVKL